MNMPKFEDSFWNAEFCNFSGFEAVQRRMQDGKQMLKAYVEFLKLKAQAQKAYGRALIKLLHSTSCKEEIGSLKNGWDSLRSQTEIIGTAQLLTASHVMAEADRMAIILECQREQRRCTEENVRKSQANLSSHFKKAVDCKKSYDNRCKEKESISQLSQCEEAKLNENAKEVERLLLKQEKARLAADVAQQSYKASLRALEETRGQWERQTEDAYNSFQMLEEDRISCLRNSMWIVTNLGSSVCVQEDAALEEVRKTLETCDIAADIEEFIRLKRTGFTKPPTIDVEDCSTKLPKYSLGSSFRMHSRPRMLDDLPQLLFTGKLQRRNEVEDGVDDVAITNMNGIYESIDEMGIYSEPKVAYKVCHPYEGKTPSELSLHPDDIVYITFKESDHWWEVETKDGAKGYYPAEYLEPNK